jgi:hypothetical protein
MQYCGARNRETVIRPALSRRRQALSANLG